MGQKRFRRFCTGAVSLVALGVALEILLRLVVDYNPSYYVGFYHQQDKTIVFPYGIIHYNSRGYPDGEFLPQKIRPRIGYFGDSVCYGVGAGFGYRVSDLLEEMLPQYEHMNFSMIGTDISPAAADTILRHVKTFDLDKVCFLMNLNDVLPDPVPDRVTTPRPGMGKGVAILRVLRSRLDWLRGRSYLYTHLRSVASNYYAREGFESHGQIGYEFYPHQYKHVIAQTAARINALSDALGELGCELVVVMLPYEMQISQAAATTYAALGVRWESDFVYGSTQQLISACLRGVTSLNAYGAFIPLAAGGGEVDAWRQRNDVGEYFVYNRGDRLDWNHLNRQGHRRVAEFIYRQHVLDTGSPASLPLPAASGTPGGRPWPQSATHAASSERVAR